MEMFSLGHGGFRIDGSMGNWVNFENAEEVPKEMSFKCKITSPGPDYEANHECTNW